MSISEGLVYLGRAFVYGLALTLVGSFLLRRLNVSVDGHHVLLAIPTLFVVFLAIHPFPDPAALDCTGGGVPPMLKPFGSLGSYPEFWAARRPLGDWLTAHAIVAPAMNVVLFMLPGTALARLTKHWSVAFMFGLGLTLFNEITQLTALYGVYPCRYRYVSVDDLMFNTLGVLLGFWLGGMLWRKGNKQRR